MLFIARHKCLQRTPPSLFIVRESDVLLRFNSSATRRNHFSYFPFRVEQIANLLPNLTAESDVNDLFSRMDHNGDGVIDLTDFLMWEERMQDGRSNTDYWALQEVNTSTGNRTRACTSVGTDY